MPELPEVEVVRHGLEPALVGRTLRRVDVLHPLPVRRHAEGPEAFARLLEGRTFAVPRRREKYLWLPFADGDATLVHLGMSGQFRVHDVGEEPGELHRHTRLRLHFDDDGPELRFVDQRMFGGWEFAPGGAELPARIAHIAPDPFEAEFSADAVVRRVRASRAGIKRLLLDQTVVSGICNIYADETLWRARLHGDRVGQTIPAKRVREVLDHAREVMSEALAQGGTSFDALYVNVNGESGMRATERNVPRRRIPVRARRSPYFGGACATPLSPIARPLPAKPCVDARSATGRGYVDRCSFRSLRLAVRQFGQCRQAARGIELDRALRRSSPGAVVDRHGAGLRTRQGAAHA